MPTAKVVGVGQTVVHEVITLLTTSLGLPVAATAGVLLVSCVKVLLTTCVDVSKTVRVVGEETV